MSQVFIERNAKLTDDLAFERKLYVIRKRAESAIRYSGKVKGKKRHWRPSPERNTSMAGPAARNAVSRNTAMPARSNAWFTSSQTEPGLLPCRYGTFRCRYNGTRLDIRVTFSFAITVAGAIARGARIANSVVSYTKPILKRSKVL